MRRPLHMQCIVWLALAAYLLLPLGGMVVLCEGVDGHRAFELGCGDGACDSPLPQQQPSAPPVVQRISAPDCQDTPLLALVTVEPVPPRAPTSKLILLSPALLPALTWSQPQHRVFHGPGPTGPPVARSHLDVLQGVVLLI